jgi:hypothetical protein
MLASITDARDPAAAKELTGLATTSMPLFIEKRW